jgi:hypothetical protein
MLKWGSVNERARQVVGQSDVWNEWRHTWDTLAAGGRLALAENGWGSCENVVPNDTRQ